MEEGYRHVRAQMGGYGGGGHDRARPGQPSGENGFAGAAFDEDVYIDAIPKLFEHLRAKLGHEVKLLHDVHEHLIRHMARGVRQTYGAVSHVLRGGHPAAGADRLVPPHQESHHHADGHGRAVHQPARICAADLRAPDRFHSLPRLADRRHHRGEEDRGLCEDFGVRTAWQEGGDNDPVNQLAAYHVDLSIPSFGIQEENHFPAVVHDMLPGTAELRHGYLYGNGAPGLGIDVNEEALKYPPQPVRPGDSWTTVRGMDGSLVKP